MVDSSPQSSRWQQSGAGFFDTLCKKMCDIVAPAIPLGRGRTKETHPVKKTLVSAAALCCLLSAACSADSPASEANNIEEVEQTAKSYVVTRMDARRCAPPMCGGVFVKEANQEQTQCLDGSLAEECYVGELDLSDLGLSLEDASAVRHPSQENSVLLEGRLAKLDQSAFDADIAYLQVSAAHVLATEASSDALFMVKSTGIACVTAPCPSFEAALLNADSLQSIGFVQLDALELDDDAHHQLQLQLAGDGAVVAGTIVSFPGFAPDGSMPTEYRLDASSAYLKLEADTCSLSPGAEYLEEDANTCMAMRFGCDPGSLPFFNACGCGCEPQ